MHIKIIFLRHPGEKRHGTGFVVDGINVFSSRHHADIFRIFTADGKDDSLSQQAGFFISLKNTDAVISCVGTEDQFPGGTEAKGGGGVNVAVVFSYGRDGL